jgi:flavin reductase (DIM6/NTAB) family NADH-FMN oxidoreductase RutF
MVSEDRFRRVMGHFATGVTVVATRDREGEPLGLTVNAFTSVSLEPPLVLVCLHVDADAHDPVLEAGHFGVSILTSDQEELAFRFAQAESDTRFRGVEYEDGPLGSPLLRGSLGWLECRVEEVFPGGDHSIVVGEVVACEPREGDPLAFFRGNLKGLGW